MPRFCTATTVVAPGSAKMAKDTARLIWTFNCNRACPGCCNNSMDNMKQAKVITSIDDLAPYREILITGGEPMLYPSTLLDFVTKIRKSKSHVRIYLYTAKFDVRYMSAVIGAVDGIHYTIHAEANDNDVFGFQLFQAMINGPEYAHKSFRAYIDNKCQLPVRVIPAPWTRLECKGWIDNGECPVPQNEDLLIWGKDVRLGV